MSEKYNGWASYETWLVNLWFGNDLHDYFDDMNEKSDPEQVKEFVENYIDETVSDTTGFVGDLINAAMSEVDWYELSEAINDDLNLDEDED